MPILDAIGQSMIEGDSTVARMRLRVALHGLVLALEAAGQLALEVPVVDAAETKRLATVVTIRAASVQEMLDVSSRPADRKHEARVDAMRDAFRMLMRAHREFEVTRDRQAGARALLKTLRDVSASSGTWRDEA